MADLRLSRGWAPSPSHGWDLVVEWANEVGTPWPEALVITDLRHQVNSAGRVLGKKELMARWNWSEHYVKKMLADEERWHDPAKPEEYRLASASRRRRAPKISQASPRHLPEISQRSPATDRANLENEGEISQRSPRDLPEISQASPHARCSNNNKEQEQEDSEERRGSVDPGTAGAAAGHPSGASGENQLAPALPLPEPPSPTKLPGRVRNALHTAGIQGLQALAKRTARELRKIEGIGPKAIGQIEALLGEHGLELQREPEPTTTRGKLRQRMIATWCEAWTEATDPEHPYGLDTPRDFGNLDRWAGMLGLSVTSSPEAIDRGMARLRAAALSYCTDAVTEGRRCFPEGPPTIQGLTVSLASRLQSPAKKRSGMVGGRGDASKAGDRERVIAEFYAKSAEIAGVSRG